MENEKPPRSTEAHLHHRRTDMSTGEALQHPAEPYPEHDADFQPYMPQHLHRRQSDMEEKRPDDEGANDKGGKDSTDKKPKKMSKRKRRLLIAVAVILAIVLIVAGILYYLHARHYEDTDDAFIDGHIAQVSPQVSGRVLTLAIDDNQVVKAGQLLLEIDPRDFEAKLQQAQAQKEQGLAQIAVQLANIGQAEANKRVAEAELERANRDLLRFKSIDPKAISRQQYDQAVATAKTADAKLLASDKAIEEAKAQRMQSKATVDQASADIDTAQLQLSYTKIVAPFDGVVTKRTVEIGNMVTPGQPLLAIVSPQVWVTANFKETQLRYMKINQPVRIAIDTYPDAKFHGHVDSFQTGSGEAFSSIPAENATGKYVKVVQRVPVKIVFDDVDERDRYRLAPGMSVTPRVTVR
jgi:membrane fusion protein (multidrug efflux system)